MNNKRTALLVDASTTFREIFVHGMQARGFVPHVAASGSEGMVELARTQYDLICSAQHLPDMQGTALCTTLRRDPRYAATPFFLFTADTDIDVQRRVLPEGVTEVFHKNEIDELFNYIAHYPFDDLSLNGRVLLVEDDPALRALLAAMLARHGLQVVPCTEAEAAWQHFAAGAFDLVITDVVLTGKMSGLQLVRRIRRSSGSRGETPILAMTGFEDQSRRIELFRAGINDYISKPLLEQEFVARVNNLLLAHHAVRMALARDFGGQLRRVQGQLDALLAGEPDDRLRGELEHIRRSLTELEASLHENGQAAPQSTARA